MTYGASLIRCQKGDYESANSNLKIYKQKWDEISQNCMSSGSPPQEEKPSGRYISIKFDFSVGNVSFYLSMKRTYQPSEKKKS